MGPGVQGGVRHKSEACPIPPFPQRKKQNQSILVTFTLSLSFSALILSNLLVFSGLPLILPPGFIIPQAPVGTNMYLARVDSCGNVLWNHTYGSLDRDVGHSVIECYEGGFAIAGSTDGYGPGSRSMWLMRTDGAGHPRWNQTYGGTEWDECHDLVECEDGGLAIVGETFSFGAGESDAILIKTSLLGDVMWTRTFGDSGIDIGTSIARCEDGGFAISVTTTNVDSGFTDMWLIRTDAFGEVVWNKAFGGQYNDGANSVTLCQDGGFLLVGYTQLLDFDLGTLWLVRTDAEGNLIWDHGIRESQSQEGWSAIECADGGFAVIGTIEADYNPADIWFLRVDAEGALVWEQVIGGAQVVDSLGGYSVLACSDGGFVIAGKFGFESSRNDLWMAHTSDNGEIDWSVNYGAFHSGSGFLLAACSDGDYIITGAINTPTEALSMQAGCSQVDSLKLMTLNQRETRFLIAFREFEA